MGAIPSGQIYSDRKARYSRYFSAKAKSIARALILEKATDAYRSPMQTRAVIAVTAPMLLVLSPVADAFARDCPSERAARETAKAKAATEARKHPADRPKRRYILA